MKYFESLLIELIKCLLTNFYFEYDFIDFFPSLSYIWTLSVITRIMSRVMAFTTLTEYTFHCYRLNIIDITRVSSYKFYVQSESR